MNRRAAAYYYFSSLELYQHTATSSWQGTSDYPAWRVCVFGSTAVALACSLQWCAHLLGDLPYHGAGWMDPGCLNQVGLSLFSYLASVQSGFIVRIILLCQVTSLQELLDVEVSKDLRCYLPHVSAIL